MVDENKLHLEKLLDSGDSSKLTKTLLYISYNISDVEWAGEELMRMANDPDDDISGLALTCLGHLERVNGKKIKI
ncbi:hypothetical protein [Yokenella regensburgei]|uniref:hypothetical protein n=1 Tax=Yokenella regensburgei TaxID=158877 RepID=UPI003F5CE3B2